MPKGLYEINSYVMSNIYCVWEKLIIIRCLKTGPRNDLLKYESCTFVLKNLVMGEKTKLKPGEKEP